MSYLIVYYWNYNKICLKWQLFKQGLFLQFNFGTILKLWYFSIHFVMAFNAVVHVTLLSDWRAPNICWLWVINAATLNNILMISLRSVILLVEETGTRGAKTCLYPRNMLDVYKTSFTIPSILWSCARCWRIKEIKTEMLTSAVLLSLKYWGTEVKRAILCNVAMEHNNNEKTFWKINVFCIFLNVIILN